MIFGVGWAVGANLPALERFFANYNRIALGVVAVAAIVGVVVWVRRRPPVAPPSPPVRNDPPPAPPT